MKRTRIISAFPGTGKSHFAQTSDRTLDSDSSQFSWMSDGHGGKQRNPDFPTNYIKHIKQQVGQVDFIFVSTHKEVRDALLDNCLFFYLVYPNIDKKEEYLQRYKDRGNAEAFVTLLSKNWDGWIRELDEDLAPGCKKVQMRFPYLDEELYHILGSEWLNRC